jgi:small subunit ribosomal protein S16
MVKIKLVRIGKKGQPFFRIVVAQAKDKLKGKYIELLGFYDPLRNPAILKIDKEKYASWLSRGAQTTPKLAGLLKKFS